MCAWRPPVERALLVLLVVSSIAEGVFAALVGGL